VANTWTRIARLDALPLVLAPLAFGQALALTATGRGSWRLFIWSLALGVLIHALALFGRAASRGAGREAAIATFASLLALAGAGAALAFREGRPFMIAMVMLAPMLLWADSFPPLSLRRRGRSHWTHGVAVGLLLPVLGFYLQSGDVLSLGGGALVASFVLGVGNGLAVAERSDRRDRIAAQWLTALAALASPWVIPRAPLFAWIVVMAAGVALAVLARHRWRLCAAASVVVYLGWAGAALATVPRP
jgi:hypothetical protein